MKHIFFVLALLISTPAFAGIHDLSSFLEQGKWSVGLEPEVTFSNPAGAGFNIKPKYGLNDVINIQGILGTGMGSRKFRMGATADFDWFPDVDNQPGIATPITFLYTLTGASSSEQTRNNFSFYTSPLVYKTFNGQKAEYTPFVSFPVGWTITDYRSHFFMQFVMGSMFAVPAFKQLKFSAEAGFNISQAYSYISGGVTYFH